jgi:hypothetical protein
MLLPRIRLPFIPCLFVLFAGWLAPRASADQVLLRWYPPTIGVAAGYRVYAAPLTSGPITGPVVDVGARAPDGSGAASYSLGNLDPNAAYSVEMTAYDASGFESQRSNRVTINPRVETLGTALFQSDFSVYAPGVHVASFRVTSGDTLATLNSTLFETASFSSGNIAYGTTTDPGPVAARYIGNGSSGWTSYEVGGRLMPSTAQSQAGISAHSNYPNFNRYFGLTRGSDGLMRLVAPSEPPLTCASSASTGASAASGQWERFKLRLTVVNNRTRVRAKAWADGGAEPANWQADCWTTAAAPGDPGLFGVHRLGSGGAFFDDLSVRPVIGVLAPIP